MELDIKVSTKALQVRIQRASKIISQEMNRGMAGAQSAFNRRFARERLGTRGIRVRRKVRKKKKARGAPTVPVKMRAIGFRSGIKNRDKIHGKEVFSRSSSPIVRAHEFGAIIRPKRGQYLAVRITTPRQRSRLAKKHPALRKRPLPFVIFVRRVEVPARLGFYDTWRKSKRETRSRLGKSWGNAIRRMARERLKNLEKARARAA